MSIYGPVVLAALLAAYGWSFRQRHLSDQKQDEAIAELREGFAWVRGVLSRVYPHATHQVELEHREDEESKTPS